MNPRKNSQTNSPDGAIPQDQLSLFPSLPKSESPRIMNSGEGEFQLHVFKRNIDFVTYAESQDYRIDERSSSEEQFHLKKGDHRILITLAENGNQVYFTPGDDSNCGTIIDFIQRISQKNLDQIREDLRPLVTDSTNIFMLNPEKMSSKRRFTSDSTCLVDQWNSFSTRANRYLTQDCRIPRGLMKQKRFRNLIKTDPQKNAVFALFERPILTGFLTENESLSDEHPEGTSSLWRTSNLEKAERIIITDSPIEALSHAALTGNPRDAYISISRLPSDVQLDLLDAMVARVEVPIVNAADGFDYGYQPFNDLADVHRFSLDVDWAPSS